MGVTYKTAAQQRQDLKRINVSSLAKRVSLRTGYLKKDILEVYNCMIDVIAEEILEQRKCLEIRKIGMIYPLLQKERQANTFEGGVCKPTIIPPRWVLKFRPNQYLREEFKKISPTKAEIEAQYIKKED